MKIIVCIGTPCHIKGAPRIVEELQRLIAVNKLEDKIELIGSLCMGNCQEGVCVSINKNIYSVTPDTVEEFFNENVLKNIDK